MSEVEYFYAAHSAFAYLGSARFMEIARAADRRIVHKPYNLRKCMMAIGSTAFRARSQPHRDYFFGREIQRWSEERDAPVVPFRPTHHDNDTTLPNGVLIAGQMQGLNVDGLAHAMLEAHWRDDADLADADTLAALAVKQGFDGAALLAAASSPEVLAQYEANTEEAVNRSVFGSPTYFVDGDMFYGQDRLEMVERAMQRPYGGL